MQTDSYSNPFQPTAKKGLIDALMGGQRGPATAGQPLNSSPYDLSGDMGMPGTPGNPNTGFPGPLQKPDVGPTLPGPDPGPISDGPPDTSMAGAIQQTAPNYKYRDKLAGYDMGKFDNPNWMSPKYQVARVQAQFDPSQGLTPEYLAALNKLNLGTFSGKGDKFTLANGVPKWDGMTNGDMIGDFGGKNLWTLQGDGPGWNQPDAQHGGHAGGGAPSFAGSSISPLVQGDAQARIQQALGGFGQSDFLQQLLAKLKGGQ